VLVSFADCGCEVDGVGVGGGVVGVRGDGNCECKGQRKKAEDFYEAFYRGSPKL
jgi:hypothetical protein